GLANNTTYYYNVTSCDTTNNCSMSGPFSFKTSASPVVPVAPIISSTPTITAVRGNNYTYTMTANDGNGDSLTYNVNDSRLVQAGNVFTWNVANTEFGSVQVFFNVTDGTFVVQQNVTLTLVEDVFNLRAATFDYNTQTFIDSNIQINAQSLNSVSGVPVNFSVNSNTAYNIVNSAAGHQSDTDYVYFDERLSSCVSGQNCNLAGAYTTACTWESTYGNWYCSVVGGSLPKMTWFRYEQNPNHTLKRVNYLLP
ncbi:MAG TPA: hypothetical protein VKE88_03895, partial [Candidatus Nanoarchaeia archaeon]|nr:hypothetical protein [Candidatus Nanoarchaeia archaeon]